MCAKSAQPVASAGPRSVLGRVSRCVVALMFCFSNTFRRGAAAGGLDGGGDRRGGGSQRESQAALTEAEERPPSCGGGDSPRSDASGRSAPPSTPPPRASSSACGGDDDDDEGDDAGASPSCSSSESRSPSPPLSPVAQTTLPPPLMKVASSPALAGAAPSAAAAGPRFKLVREGDLQVCYLNHTRTVISKILSSKFLRRWETHHLYLNDSCITSKTPTGFMETSVPYSSMEEVYVVARWDAGHKFCIRIVVADGSLLLQANNAYTRDQWLHSILWKKNMFKYRNILKKSTRPEVILKELKALVDFTINTPLQDECVTGVPIEIASRLIEQDEESWQSRSGREALLSTLSPLLENAPPPAQLCRFFSQHCDLHPRSPAVSDHLTPVVRRILKHNVDFGKSPHMRKLVQDYLRALYSQNACEDAINRFVASVHGANSGCPHPRVLPNLVSVCLAAVFAHFEARRNGVPQPADDQQLTCCLAIFLAVSEYDDWRPGLAQLLQPIPFPEDALRCEPFTRNFMPVIKRIGTDTRCEVHQMVLGIREGKEGWFHIYCPSNTVCTDEGELWCLMLQTLLQCCCRRKRFISQLAKQLEACLLLALRDQGPAQEALCLMLEWQLLETEDQRMQAVTTLQSTASGRQYYAALCQRQKHLRELQQKGGPRKLTLPSRSTDADIAQLLSCGSFGNLECLSLAFTHVTSACAEQLIKLPALRYLNLWATQFGDSGLLMISEHLHKLQVLNLCETQVSDKGISALCSMTNLRKLNLNSTKLSAQTFERLKQKLPALQEFDVRYTEAW
ncbi:C-Maf-inducing protein-like [Schistocerca serialis cubense]|uniref:C-Maf-inducing protein-like n=1 Tax=Schistocerca serialis cubense TaxID=2023355 RepID=UPI00214EFF47|nr:C-Maf-inducing protein-like [Schistocerca serialis cubense]